MSETLAEAAVPEDAAQQTGASQMFKALVGIAAVSGLMIVLSYQLTLDAIKHNREVNLQRAVYEVLPGTVRMVTYRVGDDGALTELKSEDEKGVRYYAGFDASNQPRGVAIEASGKGFAGNLKVIYGYLPKLQNIIGVKVLESKETPGLGDKIVKDAKFTAQFKDLDVALTPDGKALANPIQVVKGQRSQRWQIAAITGATISSKALGNILKDSGGRDLPLIAAQVKILEGASHGG